MTTCDYESSQQVGRLLHMVMEELQHKSLHKYAYVINMNQVVVVLGAHPQAQPEMTNKRDVNSDT